MRRTGAPHARRAGARRVVLVPLVAVLAVLTGCTPPAPEGTSPAARALAGLPVEHAGAGEDYDRLGREDRVSLANDPLNLRAVDGPVNGEKSASDAAGWLPPDESFRCEYVATQIAVKARYGLSVRTPERDAMAEVLAGCPGRGVPGDVPPARDTAGPSGTDPSPVAEVHYADCAAVRAAGAAPLRSDRPGYRPALDRGGVAGLACEG